MAKKILVILGNPARQRKSLCESLALAYEKGATETGNEVRLIKIADLEFDPILHEGYKGIQSLEPAIADAQTQLAWADHIVIVYPLWQFSMPALLKGFFERVLMKGFAFDFGTDDGPFVHAKFLRNKSARIIQTMAMPSLMYRLFARQHGAKALRSTLNFCGISPVRFSYYGMTEKINEDQANSYIDEVKILGRRGA
ncbi:MAG: flavodoxin family protein [Alphaproteobacteria bacterium]|nr:MAG: flavodoxin family protein [Alphaproteobacteria bacterium]